jgi:O-antigen ligase
LLIAPRRRLSVVTLAALWATLALPVLVAATTPLAYRLASAVFAQDARDETNEKLERDVGGRAKLWAQALDRGIESRLLGLGPGPHLVRPAELREPRLGWLPDFEAHNTFVDIFLQGGLLALACLLWLLLTAVRTSLNSNLSCLPALVISMAAFAMTHFVIRHPIVWFVVALAFAAGTSYQQRAMKADRWHRARQRA